VFHAVYKAYRDSKKAKWLPEQNWEALLKEPIDEVREELGIRSPAAYRQLLSTPAMA
jgi:ubiquinone biosynthesis protein Coq4